MNAPKTDLTAPIIHLNGSSGVRLIEDYQAAINSIQNAIAQMRASAPHGRDYYVSRDPNALNKATEEHQARVAKLQDVMDELERLAWNVQDQLDAREKR